MKINKLTASFGILSNETIEFHDGLNVIARPNESGKSTWCAFIRAMLYGVDSSERAKAGYLPDKLRYAPWSGTPMEGSMELSSHGMDITLTRTSRSPSAPMREFSAVRTGTGIPVDWLDAQTAGEKLTGVSRDVFRRSAFVEQGALAVSGSPELEKRIAAIVSTGEEDTSYSEADERLRAWQRSRRFNKRGRLPELENDIADCRDRLKDMEEGVQGQNGMRRRLEDAESDCARLEGMVTESRRQYRRDALDKLSQSRAELEKATQSCNDLSVRARADRAALEHNVIGDREPATVTQEAKRDRAQAEALRQAAEHRGSPAGMIVMIALFAAALALGIFFNSYMFAAAALFAAGAVLLGLNFKKKAAAAAQAAVDRRKILETYSASCEEDIDSTVEEYRGMYAACMAAEQEEADAKARLEDVKRRHGELESATLSDLDFANGSTEAASLGRQLSAAKQERERLAAAIAQTDGRLQTMGDPLVIKSSIENMESERERLQEEYDAIALAVDALKRADEEIQSRFSPELGRCAAEYMSIMTGGKYDSLFINRDFTVRARAQGDSVPRESEYLSAGTLDLLYLAVRLAVCRLALPEEDKCPIILDDPMVNFDAERQEKAMKLLEEIAKERQVILFSRDCA